MPALEFQRVTFSPIDYRTMQRYWAAVLAVDASSCATTSGPFEILFDLLSETAPDDNFTRSFSWTPGTTNIAVDLMAQEWIDGYRLSIATCPCHD
jgi:hypothetical protein